MESIGLKQRKYPIGFSICWFTCICLLAIFIHGCGGDDDENDSADNYKIEYSLIMDCNYESGTVHYQNRVGLSYNDNPIDQTDVVEIRMTDSSDVDQTAADEGFYHSIYMWSDCSTGSCGQMGPIEDTGWWRTFDSLEQGSYTVEIDMENGQTLTATRSYADMIELPFVDSDSMNAEWSGGDLVLNWIIPKEKENWEEEVDQLRIVIFDELGNEVLYVQVALTDERVILPADLVTQAVNLQGGSSLSMWEIQTRALNTDLTSLARGYSEKIALPALP